MMALAAATAAIAAALDVTDAASIAAGFDAAEAFGDLYDESIISSQRGVEGARDAARSEFGSVDYTRAEAWPLTCDNYL